TLGRMPAADEKTELLGLLKRQQRRIADGWVNPYELATGKNEKPETLPAGTNPTQLAAYTVVSRALLNLDETITKEEPMTTPEHFFNERRNSITRRWFFKECGVGLGTIALGSLLNQKLFAAGKPALSNPLTPKAPHFAPKAKRVIYLFMAGAPSHL